MCPLVRERERESIKSRKTNSQFFLQILVEYKGVFGISVFGHPIEFFLYVLFDVLEVDLPKN